MPHKWEMREGVLWVGHVGNQPHLDVWNLYTESESESGSNGRVFEGLDRWVFEGLTPAGGSRDFG